MSTYRNLALVMVFLTPPAFGQIQKAIVYQGSVPPSVGTLIPVLSPIPLYPGGAVAANQFSSTFLFVDPKSGELVISYPDNVDSPNYFQNPGPRQELRVKLSRDISAMAYVSFGLDASGRYTYAYTLSNERDAKQDLSYFSVPVPSPGSNLPRTAISDAFVSQHAPTIGSSAGWLMSNPQADKGIVHVAWSQPGPSGIPSGRNLGGFTIASTLKPGFVTATAKGTSPVPNLGSLKVPLRVHQALIDLESSGFNEKSVLTIGPQFPSETSLLRRVLNFREGLVILEQHGYLKSNSLFANEAIAVFTRYLDGAKFGVDGPASDYVGPLLALNEKPVGALESQIYEAMKLSLGLK